MQMCNICFHTSNISYNYGGFCCQSCTAFFRRSVRSDSHFECKHHPALCEAESFVEVRSPRAKRAVLGRIDDVAELNSLPLLTIQQYTTNPTTGLPIVDSMVHAMRTAFQYRDRFTVDQNQHVGDPDVHQLTHADFRRKTFHDLKVFRYMLDYVPIISGLDKLTKDTILRNSMRLFVSYANSFTHFRQPNPLPGVYYMKPDTYVIKNVDKIAALYENDPSARLPTSKEFYGSLARKSLHNFQFILEHVVGFFQREHFQDEDLAILLLLLILQTNEHAAEPKIKEAVLSLKSCWKEIDTYYQRRNKDPSFWGNLLMLVSSFHTSVSANEEVYRTLQFISGKGALIAIEKRGAVENCKSDDF
ncbi:hypothetical protein L596_026244 [Steinernema carpocapsae]|uniref:Nuclear receptor domain-containing protein n=1 Tax=Steinernema carpocapsae TaxID=34508 RepID=A0A4U5M0S2_STECR|nr:hypothetical protein L596_026244 [Steinernema carpocapsae]